MAIVELDNVTLYRGDTCILSNVSWRIERGERWALLGANGSGKTTLLKVVTGYEWPSEGTVSVLGERYGRCSLPELRRSIGWVSMALEQRLPPRDRALEVAASGFHASMGLYREIAGWQWDRAREMLRQVGADAIADRAFGLLSQGEQQRVLIARALVNEPALLILDEPCAGLDPVAREAFLEDVRRLADGRDAPTIILVTHHVEEIGPGVGHTLALREGRVVGQGPTPTILTSRTMSAVFGRPCRVRRGRDRYALTVEPGR